MKDFAAIDFETANQQRTSVCSVGIVIVRDGEIADSYYSLIKPEPEYYSYWNTRVHGLTLEDTMNADVFPKVWAEIAPKIEGLPLVAHNAPFDEGCLKAVFQMYQMEYPGYEFHCTCRASRRKLGSLLPQPSAPDRSRLLRLRPHPAPQCPGRCRSLCLDSKRAAISQIEKFVVFLPQISRIFVGNLPQISYICTKNAKKHSNK